jgi:hypothetical protein
MKESQSSQSDHSAVPQTVLHITSKTASLPHALLDSDGPATKSDVGGITHAINMLRFFCVLFIVPLHCTYSHRVPIPPCGLVKNAERFLCSFPSLSILMLLSGFLFFRTFRNGESFFSVWRVKLRRRIPALLVPYLLWTAASFAWCWLFNTFPEGMSAGRPTDVLRWFVGVDGWRTHPGGFGLWYLKSLMIASLLAPLYWLSFRVLGSAAILVGIFLCAHPPLPVDHPLFSSWYFLGGGLAFNGVSLEKATARMHGLLPLTVAAFFGYQVCRAAEIDLPAFSAFVPFLLAAALFSACFLRTQKNRLLSACQASTFLYFSHFFVSQAIGQIIWRTIPLKTGGGAAMAYFARTFLTIALCILLFFIVRRIAPRALAVVTGNRC